MAANGRAMLVPLLLVYQILAWIVALAGVAAVQDMSPSWAWLLEWFILFFQLALIVAMPVLSVAGMLFRVRISLISFLTITSTMWLVFANKAYDAVRSTWGSDNRFNTLVAGASLLFMGNVAAVILIDLDTNMAPEVAIPNTRGSKEGPAPTNPAVSVSTVQSAVHPPVPMTAV